MVGKHAHTPCKQTACCLGIKKQRPGFQPGSLLGVLDQRGCLEIAWEQGAGYAAARALYGPMHQRDGFHIKLDSHLQDGQLIYLVY